MDALNLQKRIIEIENKLDVSTLQAKQEQLKTQSIDPDLWQDQSKASLIMQELSDVGKTLSELNQFKSDIDNLVELGNLLISEPDETLAIELEKNINKINSELTQLENQTYLSGKYDKNFAIFSIHSGQGGTEAMDWASILQRMYLRYFDKKGWKYEMLDMVMGDEAGIKSVSFKVSAPYAYGYLCREGGVHRLVRLSPFNADQLRQTSFAKVEVSPVISGDQEMAAIRPEDVEFAAYRSGGSGGQNVNKVSTAVRIIHKATGLVFSCQSQRSQEQNRMVAMEMLASKLWALEQEKRAAEQKDIKGDNIIAGWGHQIRSYVLHPYKMVKDLRTRYETSLTDSVLDGNLDEFISAELRLL
ncbi:MAG: peptide chain release factor 2 [Candidatus Shapirobacteria bacterium]